MIARHRQYEQFFGYDNRDRLEYEIASDYRLDYTYFNNGSVKTVKDSDLTRGTSKTTQYAYDDLGRIDTETHLDQRTTRYDYDLQGNVKSVTASSGEITAYTYDTRNRLSTVLSSGKTFTYGYYSLLSKHTYFLE